MAPQQLEPVIHSTQRSISSCPALVYQKGYQQLTCLAIQHVAPFSWMSCQACAHFDPQVHSYDTN